MVHILHHWILTTPWTVTYLHFTDGETASLRVLIRWYGHPAVYLAQSPHSNLDFTLERKHCQGRAEREKKDPVLETFPEKRQGPKYSLWNQNMSPLHFLSYLRRKRDGAGGVWGAQEKFRQLCLGALRAREMRCRGSSGGTPKYANNIACSGRSSTWIPSSRSFCYHISLLL